MPAVALHRHQDFKGTDHQNPLPQILHTPAGLALLEIQGTIHAPLPESTNSLEVGQLQFPLYNGNDNGGNEGPWMKKVYLYVGKHQRLTGEIKKLAKPIVILDKDTEEGGASNDLISPDGQDQARLNIVAIIKHKILFSSRPEPVGL